MNKNDYIIRLETKNDYREVETLIREAFWNLNVPGCDEHYLAHILRDAEDFIPELDFVLEKDHKIIGHIMYSKSKLVDESGHVKTTLSFGPLSILPEYQRQGYGKILLEHSFKEAISLGYDTVIIFGNPANYVSRGFKSAHKYNIRLDGGYLPMALQVKELIPQTWDGKTRYFSESPAFDGITEEAVQAFDASFDAKVKEWQPSQEEFYIHCHSSIN